MGEKDEQKYQGQPVHANALESYIMASDALRRISLLRMFVSKLRCKADAPTESENHGRRIKVTVRF